MDLVLYKASASGQINLSGLVQPGEHFTAAKHIDEDGKETGTILLTPVRVQTSTTKRTAAALLTPDAPEADEDEDTPFN